MKYLIIISLLFLSCDEKKTDDSLAIKEIGTPVKMESLNLQDVQDELEITSRLEALQEINIVSMVGGRVSSFVENGKYVNQNDIIYEADANLYYQQFLVAKTQLELAEKNFSKLENNYLAYKKLLTSKDISEDEFLSSEINYLTSKQSLSQAKVSSEQAKINYQNASFRAPFSGVVGQINLNIGEQLSPGQAVAKLADLSRLKAIVNLSIDEVIRFKKGDQAIFKNDLLELVGTIESVSPIADTQTGTYLCKIVFPAQKNRSFVTGIFGKIFIKGKRYKNVFTTSQDNIISKDGKRFIFKVIDKKTVQTEIIEQAKIGKKSIITGDIKVTDIIVISSAGKLINNIPVSEIK